MLPIREDRKTAATNYKKRARAEMLLGNATAQDEETAKAYLLSARLACNSA